MEDDLAAEGDVLEKVDKVNERSKLNPSIFHTLFLNYVPSKRGCECISLTYSYYDAYI